MIKSMTGFGRAQGTVNELCVTVEIKSVNHRYFEFSSRIPRAYGYLDEKLKSYIQSKVARGKVECFVSIDDLSEGNCVVNVNQSLASAYYNAYKLLSEQLELRFDASVNTFSRNSDIFTVQKNDADDERVWSAVSVVAESAIKSFIEMREREGEKLKADVLNRCELILKNVEFIEERSPQTVIEYNQKLLERMKTVLEDVHVDEQRLLTEAAIFADKIAVAEETVRLRSHVEQMREFMNSDVAIGRKADFLIQEFNREANTIGSKAQDVSIAKKVIDIKAEIEKIREQIQNVE